MLSSLLQRFPQSRYLVPAVIIVGLIVGLSIAFWPPDTATTAQDGDTVKIAYVGTYDNGSVFDSANSSAALEFTIGSGSMISGFESGIIGMSLNQTRSIHIPANEGYGLAEYVADIGLFPSDVAVGQYYSGSLAGGQYIENARVTAVDESTVTLENLHPLAGENLNFEVTLVELIKADEE